MKPTTAIVLDTRRAIKDNKFPVKLRVTYLRKRKYYGTQYKLTSEEWARVNGAKTRADQKEIRFNTSKIIAKADEVIKKMEIFSFEQFEKQYFENAGNYDVTTAFQNYIDKLTEQARISTASSCRCAKKSLKKFREGLLFQHINPDFLKKYEAWTC